MFKKNKKDAKPEKDNNKKPKSKNMGGDMPSHDELIKLGLDPSNFTQNIDVHIDNNELNSMLSNDIEDIQVDMNEEDENDHNLSDELDNLDSHEEEGKILRIILNN
jgi:hypothetical protein